MIDLVEQLHSIGFIHGDLKPENFMVGDYKDEATMHKLKLIDFGLCQRYNKISGKLCEPLNDKEHILEVESEPYGNIAFCSRQSLKGRCLSRRDDLESILQILIFLETGQLCFKVPNDRDFRIFKSNKLNWTPIDICYKMNCIHFLEFAEEIYRLKFTEKPYYDKLKFLLVKIMLKKGEHPN